MSTEPRAAVRWAIQTLNADGTFAGLVADGQAYQRLPRAADTVSKPGVAVGFQSTQPPTGAINTGDRAYTQQTVRVRVQVSQQTSSRTQIEVIEARVLSLLGGRGGITLSDGEVFSVGYGEQMPDREEDLGDAQIITSMLLFETSLKVN